MTHNHYMVNSKNISCTVNADNDLTKGLGYEISLIDDVCISTIRVLNGPKELNKYADNFSNLLMQAVSLYKGVLNILKILLKTLKILMILTHVLRMKHIV